MLTELYPDLLTTQDVAELLHVTPEHVYNLTYRRRLPYTLLGTRHGGVRLYRRADVEALQNASPALGRKRRRELLAAAS